VVAVFWLGVHAGQRGELTWGALFQFAFLSVFAASSVGALGEMWGDVQKAVKAGEAELRRNPRARSATLRSAIRSAVPARAVNYQGLGVPEPGRA
jgi:ATP-binding cassette subfamily B protein